MVKVTRVLATFVAGLVILGDLTGCSLYEAFTGADITKTIVLRSAVAIRPKEAAVLSAEVVQIVNQVALSHGLYRFEPSPYVVNAIQPAIVLAYYKDNRTQPPSGLTVYMSVVKRDQQLLPEILVSGESLSSGTMDGVVDTIVKRLQREIPAVDSKVDEAVTHGRF